MKPRQRTRRRPRQAMACQQCGKTMPPHMRSDAWLCSAVCKRARKKATSAARYRSDPERQKALCRAWRVTNLERHREMSRDWNKSHPDAVKDSRRKWLLANPDFSRTHTQQRRAIQASAFVDSIDMAALFQMHSGKCGICGKTITAKWDLDHIVPLSRGGLHSWQNVQPTHPKCNRVKNASVPLGQIGLFQVKTEGMTL